MPYPWQHLSPRSQGFQALPHNVRVSFVRKLSIPATIHVPILIVRAHWTSDLFQHTISRHPASSLLHLTAFELPRLLRGKRRPEARWRLAQQGNAAAFESLYQLHNRRVYSLCLRMVGNTAEAEDLTQEAFLQLFRKISTFRGESAFSTWLHRLAVNVVLMKLRKKSGKEMSLEQVTDPDEESGTPRRDFGTLDVRLSGSLDRVNLQRAVEQLPPGYKAVFVLHDVQGFEHNEIAEIMGCSIGNSKSQLHKARMRLRDLLHETVREKAREDRRAAGGASSSED
jgi:RNA polymerase sigma-70 factor (ECF subfamily)